MTRFPIASETDPVRRAIIAAMNRLFAGTPQRSNGRLSVTPLAIEADLKRWHLTHQHPDLKDLFQEQAAKDEAKRSAHVQSANAFEDQVHRAPGPLSVPGGAAPDRRDRRQPACAGERRPLWPGRRGGQGPRYPSQTPPHAMRQRGGTLTRRRGRSPDSGGSR